MMNNVQICAVANNNKWTVLPPSLYGDQGALEKVLKEHPVNSYVSKQPLFSSASIYSDETVAYLTTALVDIDIDYDKNYSNDDKKALKQAKQELEEILIKSCNTGKILPYHILKSSGTGYNLIYKLNNLTDLNNYKPTIAYIIEDLKNVIQQVEILQQFNPHIDIKNSFNYSGVTRIIGSINSKSNDLVKVIHSMNLIDPYTYNDIADYFGVDIDDIKDHYKKYYNGITNEFIKKEVSRPSHFTLKSMSRLSIKDLELIQDYHNFTGRLDGYRNNFLWIYASRLTANEENNHTYIIENELERINNKFKKPLPSSQVRALINQAIRKKFNISNQTIIDDLYITPQLERQLKLIISETEKKRRRNQRLKNKRANQVQANKNKRELRNQSIYNDYKNDPLTSHSKLAKKYNLSKAAITKIIKKCDEVNMKKDIENLKKDNKQLNNKVDKLEKTINEFLDQFKTQSNTDEFNDPIIQSTTIKHNNKILRN